MKHIILSVFIIHTAIISGHTEIPDLIDSAQNAKPDRATTKLITRLHSLGQFSYGGRIVSDHPVIDFNFTYDRKNWGLQIFKALDLHDSNTPINFTLAVLNKRFQVGKRFTITPSAGFILEQSKTFADYGSDVVLIITSAYKFSKVLTFDHSALFGNLLLDPEQKDWVNRFRLLYSKNNLDLTAQYWHNNKIFDTTEYMTYGVSAFYSRVKIADGVSLNAEFTCLVMPYSNEPLTNPKKNGLIFTVAMVLD